MDNNRAAGKETGVVIVLQRVPPNEAFECRHIGLATLRIMNQAFRERETACSLSGLTVTRPNLPQCRIGAVAVDIRHVCENAVQQRWKGGDVDIGPGDMEAAPSEA